MNKRWVLVYCFYISYVKYILLVDKMTTVFFHKDPLCHLANLVKTIYVLENCLVMDAIINKEIDPRHIDFVLSSADQSMKATFIA